MRPRTRDETTLIGLDLGQQKDYTAISITERVPVRSEEKTTFEYRVRHLERPALGTPYTEVVERVVALVQTIGQDAPTPALVVDATGVGRPVMDMLWQKLDKELEGSRIRVTPCAVTITGGDSVTKNPDGGGWRVPKRDLVSAALVLLQNKQLKIAEGLKLRETLVKELLNFRVKINISTAHDSYEA